MKKIRQRNLQLILDAACEVFADLRLQRRPAQRRRRARRRGEGQRALLLPLKAQLYEAVLDSIVEPLLEASRPFAVTSHPAEALRAYVDNKMRIGAERPHAGRVFSCEIMRARRMPAALLDASTPRRNATPSASASGSTKACWRRWIRTTCCSTCGR